MELASDLSVSVLPPDFLIPPMRSTWRSFGDSANASLLFSPAAQVRAVELEGDEEHGERQAARAGGRLGPFGLESEQQRGRSTGMGPSEVRAFYCGRRWTLLPSLGSPGGRL